MFAVGLPAARCCWVKSVCTQDNSGWRLCLLVTGSVIDGLLVQPSSAVLIFYAIWQPRGRDMAAFVYTFCDVVGKNSRLTWNYTEGLLTNLQSMIKKYKHDSTSSDIGGFKWNHQPTGIFFSGIAMALSRALDIPKWRTWVSLCWQCKNHSLEESYAFRKGKAWSFMGT